MYNADLGEYEGYDTTYDIYVDDNGNVHDFTIEHLEIRKPLYTLAESCDRARERQRLADRSIEERARDFDSEHPFLSGLFAGFAAGSIKDWFTSK